ncbi:hypothetical protein D3C86_1260120 [compost metagenome]
MVALAFLSEYKFAFVGAGAVLAFAAAVLWYVASTAVVYEAQRDDFGGAPYMTTWEEKTLANDKRGRTYEVVLTGMRQGVWNRRAAACAALAALVQAVTLLIPDVAH